MSTRSESAEDSSQSGSEYQDSDSLQSDYFEQSPARSSARASIAASEDDPDDLSTDEVVLGDDSSKGTINPRTRFRGPKLKRDELKAHTQAKQLPGWYRPKYRRLFNSVVEETVNPVNDSDTPLDASTIGVSHWTAEEKSQLFAYLGLKGRGDSRALSLGIGSKSASEVREYLDLLQQGSVENYLRPDARHGEINYDEIPAAFEVDPECEAELDLAAGKLAYKVEVRDQGREQKRHGDYWLLTPTIADELEATLSDNVGRSSPTHSDDEEAPASIPPLPVPAASLLNLSNWLELASLFMSSSADHTTSWVDLVESNDERPSIYHTAFTDFHRLTVDLTKRLVSASIFHAMSRLRATAPKIHVVRHHDVQAACRVLSLDSNWGEYWVHAPRRIGLEVWTRGRLNGTKNHHHDDGYGVVLDYDRVETALRSGQVDIERFAIDSLHLSNEDNDIVPSVESSRLSDSDCSSASYDPDFWTDASSTPDREVAESPRPVSERKPSPTSTSSSSPSPPPDALKAETACLSSLDALASAAHNAELRSILVPVERKRRRSSQSTPSSPRKKARSSADPPVKREEESLPPAPRRRSRREREEHVRVSVRDWRERVAWRPEWIGGRPGRESFNAVGRRGVEGREKRVRKREMRAKVPDEGEGQGSDNEAEADNMTDEDEDLSMELGQGEDGDVSVELGDRSEDRTEQSEEAVSDRSPSSS